jgi:hypothetical protein
MGWNAFAERAKSFDEHRLVIDEDEGYLVHWDPRPLLIDTLCWKVVAPCTLTAASRFCSAFGILNPSSAMLFSYTRREQLRGFQRE